MKKSLIALAALAAVTAASAQSSVTISGKFGTAYDQPLGTAAAAKGKANLAVTDGNIDFNAVEDLGGGLKAGASMALRVRGRGNVVQTTVAANTAGGTTAQTYAQSASTEVGRNATVFLSGPFGTLTAGSIEIANGISGRAYAGTVLSTSTGLDDGGVLSGAAYANALTYTSPTIQGLAVTVGRFDSIGTVGIKSTAIAASGSEADLGLAANVVGLNYANGPLTAGVDSTTFTGSTTIGGTTDRKRTRMSADYDFGFVKIGFGQEDNKGTPSTASTTFAGKQTAFGISAPITSALRVGIVSLKNTESGALAAVNGSAKGTGVSADYSFSKRTTLNASYATIARDDLTDNANYNKEGTQYRIRLMHSF